MTMRTAYRMPAHVPAPAVAAQASLIDGGLPTGH